MQFMAVLIRFLSYISWIVREKEIYQLIVINKSVHEIYYKGNKIFSLN